MSEVRVHFQGLEPSDAVTDRIGEHMRRLERHAPRIEDCRVTISTPHRHRTRHRPYSVHVDLHVPGRQIVASHDSDTDDVYVAVKDAFLAVERQLADVAGRRDDARRS